MTRPRCPKTGRFMMRGQERIPEPILWIPGQEDDRDVPQSGVLTLAAVVAATFVLCAAIYAFVAV